MDKGFIFKTISIFIVVCSLTLKTSVSQNYYISGTISDFQNGEYLPLAAIYNKQINNGTSSNLYGFYSLKLPKGVYVIEFSYVGYEKQIVSLNLTCDTVKKIQLKPNIQLSEVIISAENNKNRLQSTKVSNHIITAKSLHELPALLGETDIIKELRLLPGVNASAEGAAGLIIRGGGPDENLILLDGVPIYNINHLNSFFSVFNTDALAQAEIYKGAYPARYGGRISSVVDVRMREGNMKKMEGKISIGTIASKLTLEGPFIKDRSSFIVSARRSYLDMFALPAQYFFDSYSTLNYIFDDYNLKINYLLNSKNRIYLSAYKGKDRFYNKSDYTKLGSDAYKQIQEMDWGNAFVSARWNSEISKQIFLNVTGYYYRYHYRAGDEFRRFANEGQEADEYRNKQNKMLMNDWSLKSDFDLILNPNNHIRYGAQYIYHKFLPNEYSNYQVDVNKTGNYPNYTFSYDTISTYRTLGEFESHEVNAYVEDEISIGTLFKLNAGLHYSAFIHKNEFYNYLLPCISMVYMTTSQLSIKLARGKYSQYSFLITNPIIGMPTDIWLQSIQGLQPMTGWQTVLGAIYNTNFNLMLSTELFYKHTKNVTEFKEQVPVNLFNSWNDVIEQGEAQNYGFETMAEMKTIRYNIKLSYSYIRAVRTFENLNNGNPFYYSFDSPHNINIEGNIKLSKMVNIGASWSFASGKLITLVEQEYIGPSYFDNIDMVSIYESTGILPIGLNDKISAVNQRNNHRLPAYHKLDIGVNFKKDKKRGERVWSFGVSNVYNRHNVYYIELWGGGYKQYSISSILPFVSYSFKF